MQHRGAPRGEEHGSSVLLLEYNSNTGIITLNSQRESNNIFLKNMD